MSRGASQSRRSKRGAPWAGRLLALVVAATLAGGCALSLDFDGLTFDERDAGRDAAGDSSSGDVGADADQPDVADTVDDTDPADVVDASDDVRADALDGTSDAPTETDVPDVLDDARDDVETGDVGDARDDADDVDADVCTPEPEVCDGVDNNCNGLVDAADPAMLACEPIAGAEVECVEATCQIVACDEGRIDIDGDSDNGCEFGLRHLSSIYTGTDFSGGAHISADLYIVSGDYGAIFVERVGSDPPEVVAAFSTDGDPVAVAGNDDRAALVDDAGNLYVYMGARTGSIAVERAETLGKTPSSVAIRGDRVLVGYDDGTIEPFRMGFARCGESCVAEVVSGSPIDFVALAGASGARGFAGTEFGVAAYLTLSTSTGTLRVNVADTTDPPLGGTAFEWFYAFRGASDAPSSEALYFLQRQGDREVLRLFEFDAGAARFASPAARDLLLSSDQLVEIIGRPGTSELFVVDEAGGLHRIGLPSAGSPDVPDDPMRTDLPASIQDAAFAIDDVLFVTETSLFAIPSARIDDEPFGDGVSQADAAWDVALAEGVAFLAMGSRGVLPFRFDDDDNRIDGRRLDLAADIRHLTATSVDASGVDTRFVVVADDGGRLLLTREVGLLALAQQGSFRDPEPTLRDVSFNGEVLLAARGGEGVDVRRLDASVSPAQLSERLGGVRLPDDEVSGSPQDALAASLISSSLVARSPTAIWLYDFPLDGSDPVAMALDRGSCAAGCSDGTFCESGRCVLPTEPRAMAFASPDRLIALERRLGLLGFEVDLAALPGAYPTILRTNPKPEAAQPTAALGTASLATDGRYIARFGPTTGFTLFYLPWPGPDEAPTDARLTLTETVDSRRLPAYVEPPCATNAVALDGERIYVAHRCGLDVWRYVDAGADAD